MKEQRRLSQVAIDDLVEGSRSIFSHMLVRLEAGVKAHLAEAGVDTDLIGLEGVFQKIADPFLGLETPYLQEKYFRESLGLIVSLCIIK